MDGSNSNKEAIMWGPFSNYRYNNKIFHSDNLYTFAKSLKKNELAPEVSFCLCHNIQWIWRLSQIFGMNPLSLKCGQDGQNTLQDWSESRPKRRTSSKCQLERRTKSWPFANNIIWLVLHTLSTIKMSTLTSVVLALMFKGTDVYAIKIHLSARVWMTLTIIAAAGLFPKNLIKAYESIQTVGRRINHEYPKYIRIWSIALTIVCILFSLINTLYSAYIAMKVCFSSSDRMLSHVCLNHGISNHLVFIFSVGSAEVYHMTLASLLFVFALVVRSLGRGVADLMKKRLEESDEEYFLELDEELERLRLLYEQICGIVVSLRQFFGLSSLVICCDAVLTCVFGCYWRILYNEDLSEQESGNGIHHYIAFSMQMSFSVLSLFLILISGQLIANTSHYAVGVIRTTKLSSLNSAARFQINLFLQSCSGFPTKFSVYFITNLEMRFLAVASTNVITYLLVLMQFRLEQSKAV